MADSPTPDPNELFSDFQDIFQDLFGQKPTRDIHQTLELSLFEASEGCRRIVEVRSLDECLHCNGRGATDEGWRPCKTCGGTGQTRQEQGAFVLSNSCAACHGRRGKVHTPCSHCNGHGRRERVRHPTVTVPPGIDNTQVLRLVGLGNTDGEEAGNLMLAVVVAPDPRIEREGADLFVVVPISVPLAKDGGTKHVPVPGGTIQIDVPKETKTGNERRLTGCGCVRYGSPRTPRPVEAGTPYRSVGSADQRGDLVITFVVGDDAVPVSARTRPVSLPNAPCPVEATKGKSTSWMGRLLRWLGFSLALGSLMPALI